ncbi:PqiC family protein [Stakelama saccharophila]|uniref:PqiC family protein n=1 Tax=Stakelama saccharophila TaxID=3075605 RepID=A0ABZ0B943_9SPHN|nr:PqiC family protein [Stakelama sp. W311]WNO53809.1 PqiC family protein [Stakelama sp. W311]
MKRFPPASVLIMLLPLAACGGSPATTMLTLDPVPPAAPATAYAGPPLRIPALHLPATLDRVEFVQQLSAGTVQIDDFTRWAAPPGLLARDTLIRDLTQRLPEGKVLPPDAAAVTPEVRLDATVLSFDATAGEAVLQVSYRLVDAAQGREPPRRLVELRTPVADMQPVAQARALSTLLGRFADRVAADIASGAGRARR